MARTCILTKQSQSLFYHSPPRSRGRLPKIDLHCLTAPPFAPSTVPGVPEPAPISSHANIVTQFAWPDPEKVILFIEVPRTRCPRLLGQPPPTVTYKHSHCHHASSAFTRCNFHHSPRFSVHIPIERPSVIFVLPNLLVSNALVTYWQQRPPSLHKPDDIDIAQALSCRPLRLGFNLLVDNTDARNWY